MLFIDFCLYAVQLGTVLDWIQHVLILRKESEAHNTFPILTDTRRLLQIKTSFGSCKRWRIFFLPKAFFHYVVVNNLFFIICYCYFQKWSVFFTFEQRIQVFSMSYNAYIWYRDYFGDVPCVWHGLFLISVSIGHH